MVPACREAAEEKCPARSGERGSRDLTGAVHEADERSGERLSGLCIDREATDLLGLQERRGNAETCG